MQILSQTPFTKKGVTTQWVYKVKQWCRTILNLEKMRWSLYWVNYLEIFIWKWTKPLSLYIPALMLNGVVHWFFSRIDCVYGEQSNMCWCVGFFLRIINNFFIPHRSVPSLNVLIISCFYEAPPSEISDVFRLVNWSLVLWLAKPPLVRRLNVPPLSSVHVLRLYYKQWRRLYCLSILAWLRGY